jgi:alpha-1,2-mannosyltransferase
VALAARASRRGDDATGFWLCGLASLLASPISWTHHWVLMVPALLLLVLSAFEQRSRLRWLAAAAAAAVGYSYLPERLLGKRAKLPHGLWASLTSSSYVILGLGAVLVAAVVLLRPTPPQWPAAEVLSTPDEEESPAVLVRA